MFYVYVHRRSDSGAVFYVGKGSGHRIRCKQGRNPYWLSVVAKAGGYQAEMVVRGVDEELAHLAEVELIDRLRRCGARLSNMTDGGEGMAGYVRSRESIERGASKQRGVPKPAASAALKGRPKSPEHRAKLSAARLGKSTATPETRAKMSEARRGKPGTMLGKKHRTETIEKIRAANIGPLNKFFGRKHAPETLRRLSESHLGWVHSEATRQRMSQSHKGLPGSMLGKRHAEETKAKIGAALSGEKNHRFGIKVPDEQKARQSEALRARPRVTCPHCAMTLDESNAKRWHFDNCRERN